MKTTACPLLRDHQRYTYTTKDTERCSSMKWSMARSKQRNAY